MSHDMFPGGAVDLAIRQRHFRQMVFADWPPADVPEEGEHYVDTGTRIEYRVEGFAAPHDSPDRVQVICRPVGDRRPPNWHTVRGKPVSVEFDLRRFCTSMIFEKVEA